MAMGAPVGRIHARSLIGELLSQSNGGFGAFGAHLRWHTPAGFYSRLAHRCRPPETDHTHQQGRDQLAEDELAAIFPVAAKQAQHQQACAERSRKNAERAAVADGEGHHTE